MGKISTDEYFLCVEYHIKGQAVFRNAYPECDKHLVGSVEDHQVRSGAEPWHHAMTQEPHCYNTAPLHFLLSLA